MIEIWQIDRVAAQKFMLDLSVHMTGTQLHNLASLFARHREQAMEIMREEAAKVASEIITKARAGEIDTDLRSIRYILEQAIRTLPIKEPEHG